MEAVTKGIAPETANIERLPERKRKQKPKQTKKGS